MTIIEAVRSKKTCFRADDAASTPYDFSNPAARVLIRVADIAAEDWAVDHERTRLQVALDVATRDMQATKATLEQRDAEIDRLKKEVDDLKRAVKP